MKRRDFLKTTTGTITAAALLGQTAWTAEAQARLPVALNQYTVASFYARDGVDFRKNLDACLEEMKAAGADGLEPMIHSAADSEMYGNALKKRQMQMRSLYMSVNLHEKDAARGEIERVLSAAGKAAEFGSKIVVINPAAKEGKTDEELVFQSKNFDTLGAELRKLDMALSFHYHVTELQFAAREFHHVLCGTDPKNVGICFDVHWSYRASGNSAVCAYDHARLYGDRVIEFHLRQSEKGVWTELFGSGDIDYQRIADLVAKYGKKPFIVLEQAPEAGTPQTMKTNEIFRKSLATAREIFAAYVP